MPLTTDEGDTSGLVVNRKVTYDFAPYDYRWLYRDLVSVDPDSLDKDFYLQQTIITDQYSLHNQTNEDKSYHFLYPVTAALLADGELLPTITANGQEVSGKLLTAKHPGHDRISNFETFEEFMNLADDLKALTPAVTVYEINEDCLLYTSFTLTVPAGETVELSCEFLKEASVNRNAKRSENYYDLAAKLGSVLEFEELSAELKNSDLIRILDNNFGFDEKKGITEVTLDPGQDHYYMKVTKKK